MGQWPPGLSWVLGVGILARRLYEAHLLGGEGYLDRRHSWGQGTSPRCPPWPGHPALVLETPEHWVEGRRSNLHNGEARRKGWPGRPGGLRSTAEEPFHRRRQAPGPLVGVGAR